MEQNAALGIWQEPSPLVGFHFVCPTGQVRLHPACLGSSAVKDLISGPPGPSGCCCLTQSLVSARHKMPTTEWDTTLFTSCVEAVGLACPLLYKTEK